jgi:hypothetical protein
MSALTLPLRRAYVAAFWTVVAAALAAGTGIVAAAAGRSRPWAWSAAAVLLALAPRALSPFWLETGIRAWNAGTRLASGALRRYVLSVSYYTLFRALGLVEERGALTPEPPTRRSAWRPRKRDSWLDAFASPPGQWSRSLRMYGRLSGNRWVIVLLPILHVLNVLRDEAHDKAPSSSTYTLY